MADKQNDANVWIPGLMHSGTTVVWRALSCDPRFLGFDEPLTVPQELNQSFANSRDTLSEYLPLFESDPAAFWARFTPIHPLQELDAAFTSEQADYLRYLMNQGTSVVINETHVHLHLQALAELVQHGRFIHLYRRASAFATSHLRSSYSRDVGWPRRSARRLRYEYNKYRFWTRRDFLPGLLRQEVIGSHARSKFGLLLTDAGYDADQIMRAPTLVRLLAYWHYHYHYLERRGPRLLGERYMSLRYEDFARNPVRTMRELYEWLGMTPCEHVSYRHVHPAKPAFRASDKRWREAARVAGFSDEEIETLL